MSTQLIKIEKNDIHVIEIEDFVDLFMVEIG